MSRPNRKIVNARSQSKAGAEAKWLRILSEMQRRVGLRRMKSMTGAGAQ